LHTFLKELAYPNISGKAGYKPKEKTGNVFYLRKMT
jgi:hypothetical protein